MAAGYEETEKEICGNRCSIGSWVQGSRVGHGSREKQPRSDLSAEEARNQSEGKGGDRGNLLTVI